MIILAADDRMPWQMWVYYGIGLLVAYWYQKREDVSAKDHGSRMQGLFIFILAVMWPILLFAMLVNPPDKPRKK